MDYRISFARSFIDGYKKAARNNQYLLLESARNKWYSPANKAAIELARQDSVAVYNAAKHADDIQGAIGVAMQARRPAWSRYISNVYMNVGTYVARKTERKAEFNGLLEDDGSDEFGDEYGDWAKEYVDTVGDSKAGYIVDSHANKFSRAVQQADDVEALSPEHSNLEMLAAVSFTEVACATNFGRRVAAVHTILGDDSFINVEKQWECMHDGFTRDAHADLEGTRVPFDEPYEVNGDRMMFPGDSSLGAKPSNFMNCRCWESYYYDGLPFWTY
jgi:hypothetical protein